MKTHLQDVQQNDNIVPAILKSHLFVFLLILFRIAMDHNIGEQNEAEVLNSILEEINVSKQDIIFKKASIKGH